MTAQIFRGGDLQRTITRLPGFPWARYSGELHLPGHNYTGPGTRLDMRLDANDNPKPGEEPINRVDFAALKHDKLYRNEDLSSRHAADQEMINELIQIQNPTFREKIDRAIVIPILKAKIKLGGGFADEIHKEFRRQKKLLTVKVFKKDHIHSADLVEMPIDKGFKYILTVIDLYTKFAWAIPLKNKTASTVKSAFEVIWGSDRIPKKLWVDRGKEFYNNTFKEYLKENNIEMYSTFNEGKAVVIERFNRTLKTLMFKRFTEQGSQKWITVLPELLNFYNNKIHSTIKTTPTEASKNPQNILQTVMNHNYKNDVIATTEKQKFKVGNRVRIFKWKSKFEKGYKGYWTNEVFVIAKVVSTSPITYELKDLEGEEIYGKFYTNELQKTDF